MEEEIKMLFKLSQPSNWRNNICLQAIQEDGAGYQLSPDEDKTLEMKMFWNEIGLGAYSQMDFDLGLTLDQTPEKSRGMGGILFNSQNHNFPGAKSANNVTEKGEKVDEGDKVMYRSVPPNDLYMASVLRISRDCPFPDIRKQAENVLFLIREKGGIVPIPEFDGPSTFIPTTNWPNIDVMEDDEARQQECNEDDEAIVENCIGLEIDINGSEYDDGERAALDTKKGER